MTRLKRNFRHRSLLATLLGAAALGGCASDESVGRMMVAPSGFLFYSCAQLAQQEKSYLDRNVALQRLMARAKEDAGGGLVSVMTYDPEYKSNLGYIYSIRQTQAEKNCPSANSPQPNLPPPAASPPPRRG